MQICRILWCFFCSTFEFFKGGRPACSIKLHSFSFDVKYSNFLWLHIFFFLIRPFHKSSFEFRSRLALIINNYTKSYILSTINIWKKLLSTAIWTDKNGLVSGRIACISSKNLRSETIKQLFFLSSIYSI